ncbi:GntR family transcriptional regulator [Macrococcus lamae]|uniref:GntR family transcriptional regulator n=1 Tax=Macrococcus lamae TaxID=198484 RepID=A0A4R6BV92_9STAP|nr:GntR family transcriptional regulator [Macrococcus lamae]TDM12258.1 GntR family transcriptional regulator [Macrococcus lamae]
MFNIDHRSRIPIYEQLIEGFKLQIMNGVMEQDAQLPSVRQLAAELTVNPNTIQKAYRELERSGFIYSIPGRGSFVNRIEETINRERIQMLSEELDKIIKELLFLGVSKEEIKNQIDISDEEEDYDRNQTSE